MMAQLSAEPTETDGRMAYRWRFMRHSEALRPAFRPSAPTPHKPHHAKSAIAMAVDLAGRAWPRGGWVVVGRSELMRRVELSR